MNESVPELNRVLVVDDNPAIHADFRAVLASPPSAENVLRQLESAILDLPSRLGTPASFDLTCALSGQDGLEFLRHASRTRQPFLLAFVDVRMPDGWNGLETVRQFWRVDPMLQIVICTAYSDFSWHEIREHFGSSDRLLLMRKPFEPLEIRQLAVSLCGRARAEIRLRMASRDLSEKARLAGMATVAASVLDTAGNVLNSLNVSASLLRDMILHSRLSDLRTVSNLAAERRGELQACFPGDPVIPLIPDLIASAVEVLESERAAQIEELDRVLKGAGNIRDVILIQQSYTSGDPPRVACQPETLLNDALALCRLDFALLGVTVRKEFAHDLPELLIDRAAVLQILLAILCNSREAIVALPAPNHSVVLAAASSEEGVRLSVTDSGVGISPKDADSIFSYGFSTKPGRSGFSLHDASVEAVRLGALLQFSSEGAGRGATFSLTFPTSPSRTEPQV